MGSRKMTRRRRARRRRIAEERDRNNQFRRELGRRAEEAREGLVRLTRTVHDKVGRRIIEEFFDAGWFVAADGYPNGLGKFAITLRYAPSREYREKLRALLVALAEKAPALVDRRYYDVYEHLAHEPWIRPLDTWRSRGRSDSARYRSLIDHLLVRYPVPEFLYQLVGLGRREWNGTWFFASVARGAKVTSCFNGSFLCIPMTKRMCHHFMQAPAGTPFFEAVRNGQIKSLGGSSELARAVNRTFLGCGGVRGEDFWLAVLRWFSRQHEVDCTRVGELFDYIRNRHKEDPGFSLKGRTIKSLARSMEEWHRELARMKKLHGIQFEPSGFKDGIWELTSRRGDARAKSIWTVDEILTSRELHAEGSAMRHCVYDYAADIQNKDSSIWSLRWEGSRALTVEVWNKRKMIIQAKGKCNRAPKKNELRVLRRWAKENGLEVNLW